MVGNRLRIYNYQSPNHYHNSNHNPQPKKDKSSSFVKNNNNKSSSSSSFVKNKKRKSQLNPKKLSKNNNTNNGIDNNDINETNKWRNGRILNYNSYTKHHLILLFFNHIMTYMLMERYVICFNNQD